MQIYVPIKDAAVDHWYLMVMSLHERVIYHFDSHLQLDQIDSRMHTIKILVIFMSKTCLLLTHLYLQLLQLLIHTSIFITQGEVLAQMISSEYYVHAGLPSYNDFTGWQLLDAKGIPNCGQR